MLIYMKTRAKNILNGIKGTIETEPPKTKKRKRNRYTAEPQERVDICLTCNKPAKECKGKCFGGV